ncbi:MAG: dihydroorotase family protein [Weeksellaceae bacterium]
MKLPGLIDIHVHLRDPGQTHKEDFYTGTSAALAGGFTTVFDMPNNAEPITTAQRLDRKIAEATKKTVSDIGFYFGSLGENLDQFEQIYDKVWGLKLYLNVTTGGFIVDLPAVERIYAAWKSSKPILLHSEEDMIAGVIEIIKATRQPSHFAHVSSAAELSQIIAAKESGLPVTCGVTPHHLFLTDRDAAAQGPYAFMKPYLKTQADVDFIWKNIKYVDAIESDHAPHTREEKDGENPPFGVPGLETTFPLLFTARKQGRLSLDEIIRLCHTGPKEILHIETAEDTFIEVDENTEYEIKNEELKTKCGWTPFGGMKVFGKVETVTLRGKQMYKDGQILSQPGEGKVLA